MGDNYKPMSEMKTTPHSTEAGPTSSETVMIASAGT